MTMRAIVGRESEKIFSFKTTVSAHNFVAGD